MATFTTRLFLEGMEADLSDNLDISNTYTLDNVKDLTSISSDYSLTITLPGTATNSKLFNFLFDIKSSTTNTGIGYTGKNIGYNYTFIKKIKAVVSQDGAIVFDGYAKLVSATNTNGLVSFEVQLSSELTSLVSTLSSYKLEDLYSSGVTTPYDHQLTLANVAASWDITATVNPDPTNPQTYPYGKGYFYPIADYGDFETTNGTNFYLSSLRACLYAKTYWDEIFGVAGFTYSSNFLNSEYFNRLIIPYKDGEMLRLSTQSQVAAGASGSTYAQPLFAGTYDNGLGAYLYNLPSAPLYVSNKFTPTANGNYDFNLSFDYNFTFTPQYTTLGLYNMAYTVNAVVELFDITTNVRAATVYHTEYPVLPKTYAFSGAAASTTPTQFLSLTVAGVPMLTTQYAKVSINTLPVGNAFTSLYSYTANYGVDAPWPGSATTNYLIDSNALLTVSFSSVLDFNTIEFSQFVPKDVKQIDYITSILRLFNLYMVQDRDIPKHFNIYTRDEFYSNQYDTPSYTPVDKPDLDWTNKIDKSQPIKVTPIPNLNNSQILLSYRPDEDWYNTLYKSIYGTTYGQTSIDTQYDFSKEQLDLLDGTIFSPTPVVQYGDNYSSQQIYQTEQYIEILVASRDTISVSGYKAANTAGSNKLPDDDGFTHARKGVVISYWGSQYTIINVFNSQSFQVDRNLTRTPGAVDSTYYATKDTFSYIANNDKIIPAIYQTTDQNVTRKPLKVNPRILYYAGMRATSTPYYLQYTPGTSASGVTAVYPATPYYAQYSSYPFVSHLNDNVNPTNDLLFQIPQQVFFSLKAPYPNPNLFNTYFRNQINELTDPDAKMVTAQVKLNAIDIATRDLSNSIFLDGTKYRINEISEYKPDDSLTTQVEFIRQPYQDVNVASLSLVNNISGSTYTSEMQLTVVQNTGTCVIQDPNLLSAKNFSGVTGANTSSLLGVPFGVGAATFSLYVITGFMSWVVSATINGIAIPTTWGGTNTTRINISIPNIKNGDIIVITGSKAPDPTAIVTGIMDINMTGSMTGISFNSVPVSTHSADGYFPISGGTRATYTLTNLGTSNVDISFSGVTTTGGQVSLTGFPNAPQSIPTGSSTLSFSGITLANTSHLYALAQIPLGAVQVDNFIRGNGRIGFVTGIAGATIDSIPSGGSYIGTHSAFTGTISVNISLGSSFAGYLFLKKNGTTLQAISTIAGYQGTKTFTSTSWAIGDSLYIVFSR